MNEFLTHFTSFFFTQKKQKKKKKKIGAFFSKVKTLNRDPTKRSVLEENKVFCRFFYSNDRFILSPFLYVIYYSTPSL